MNHFKSKEGLGEINNDFFVNSINGFRIYKLPGQSWLEKPF